MRIRYGLIIAGLLAALSSAAGTTRPPLIVHISVENPAASTADEYKVKAGSDIYIKVRLTNTSDRDLIVGGEPDSRYGVDMYYNHYEVRDDNGNLVPKKKLNHPEIGSTGHGWPGRVLKPGETMDTIEDRISGLYDLSKPGRYTIEDMRAVSDLNDNDRVKSNIITLVVVP